MEEWNLNVLFSSAHLGTLAEPVLTRTPKLHNKRIGQTFSRDARGAQNNKKNTDEENSLGLRENAAHQGILRLIHDFVCCAEC